MSSKAKNIRDKKRRKEENHWQKTKVAREQRSEEKIKKENMARYALLSANPWADTTPPPEPLPNKDYRPAMSQNKRDFPVTIDGKERLIPYYLVSQSDDNIKTWITAHIGSEHIETIFKALKPFSS